MPHAHCQRCHYQCRLGPHLSGKHIRCPKCRAVVAVQEDSLTNGLRAGTDTTEMMAAVTPSPPSATDSIRPKKPGEFQDLFVGEEPNRRGPLSLSQLQLLAKWDLVGVDSTLTDEAGERRATVRSFLEHGGWPPPLTRPGSGTVRTLPPRLTPWSRKPAVAGEARRKFNPFQRMLAPRPLTQSPEGPVRAKERGIADDDFVALLDRAVQMERRAAAVVIDRRVSEDGEYVPVVHTDEAKFVRRTVFTNAYVGTCIVYLLNAVVFCFATAAISGMFIKRLLGLCLSVFVPFEATAELIEGEALLAAGMSLVLICAQVLLPIWLLVRSDCAPWHCVAACAMGLLLGLALKQDHLWVLFFLVRWVSVVCGLAITAIGCWLLSIAKSQTVFQMLLMPVILTACAAVGLAALDTQGLIEVQISALPPLIRGSNPHVAIFAICFFIQSLAIPGVFGVLLYPEGSEPVKNFVIAHFIGAAVLGILGAACTAMLLYPQPLAYLAIAISLVPLSAGTIIIVMLPPLLWMLQPRYLLPRH